MLAGLLHDRVKHEADVYTLITTRERVSWIHIGLILRLLLCACSYEMLSVQSIPACADRGEPPFCYQAAAVGIQCALLHPDTQAHTCTILGKTCNSYKNILATSFYYN